MIKVFFDHQKFSTQRYGGISRYFTNIIEGIKDTPDFKYKLGVLYSANYYLKNAGLLSDRLAGGALLNLKYARQLYQLNQLYCTYLLHRNDFDVFHPTYYDPYFTRKVKKPVVVTVHDMIHECLPEYFWAMDPLTYNKRLNIERADVIIAVSESTRNDLLTYSDVNPDKVKVINHGIDTESELFCQPVKNLPENYLLFVGDRSGYKNFYLFMEAFAQLGRKHKDLMVVLTGGGNLAIAEVEFMKRLRILNRVKHINVTDIELNYVYQNALAFIYPSLHEGFGLPVLEAFKAGCPVILSDTACFREVAEEAAVYFDSKEQESLFTVTDVLIGDSRQREILIELGKERLKRFSLKKSVGQTLELYRSLVNVY